MSASLSTHVLDAGAGGPRAGVIVTLRDEGGDVLATGITDGDGRIADLAPALPLGTYRIDWVTDGPFLAALTATVRLVEDRHYHVPLLASAVTAVTYLGQ